MNQPLTSRCIHFYKYCDSVMPDRIKRSFPERLLAPMASAIHALINFDPSKIDPFLALSTGNGSLNGALTQAAAPFHFSFSYSQQASAINLIKSRSRSPLRARGLGGSRSY